MKNLVVNKRQILGMCLTIVFAIPLVALRYFALLNNTEKQSGFFIKTDVSVISFYVILVVSLVVLYSVSVIGKKYVNPFSKSRSRAIAFSGMVFAGALLVDFVMKFLEMFNTVSMADGNLIARIYTTGAISDLLQGVMAIFAAFYVLIHAFSYFGGTLNYRNFKVIGLFPALWMATRMIGIFLIKIHYMNVPHLMIELTMLSIGMIFFFNLAKMNACFENGVLSSRIFGAGWCTVLLTVVLVVPRLLMLLAGHKNLLPHAETFELVDLVMGGYIFVYMLKGNVSAVAKEQQ